MKSQTLDRLKTFKGFFLENVFRRILSEFNTAIDSLRSALALVLIIGLYVFPYFYGNNDSFMQTPILIRQAVFSPKIKTYVFSYVAFLLLITIIGIPILIIWVLGFGQYYSKRYYENLKCSLTERHLVFNKGAFYKVEKTIPLENIQDLTFLENPILNLLDLRILKIETAGGSNQHGSDMKLIGITEAESFKIEVLDQREKLRMKTEVGQNGESDSLAMLKVLEEIRDLLQKKGPN